MLNSDQRGVIGDALANHEKLKGSYWWSPVGPASNRRKLESEYTFSIKFGYEGAKYEYTSHVTCTCKNFYYKGSFLLNGERKTVRLFKNLLKKES